MGSALVMDKDVAKHLFRTAAVPTANWMMAPATPEHVSDVLGWPVVVKPSTQGSTVGLSLVRDPPDHARAIGFAADYDDEIMIEAFVPGRELTGGILDGEALAGGEIVPRHEIFDYACKYTPGMAQEIFPAQLGEALTRRCQALGLAAHRSLKLGGYSRVDFRLTAQGDLFCLEVNTLPGAWPVALV